MLSHTSTQWSWTHDLTLQPSNMGKVSVSYFILFSLICEIVCGFPQHYISDWCLNFLWTNSFRVSLELTGEGKKEQSTCTFFVQRFSFVFQQFFRHISSTQTNALFTLQDTIDESHWQKLNTSLRQVSSTTDGKYDAIQEILVCPSSPKKKTLFLPFLPLFLHGVATFLEMLISK